ncbi:MAG: DUF4878 domain-containing protein [Aquificaceae bacterium]
MKKAILILGAILLTFFLFKSCGDSSKEAKSTVEDFISAIRDENGEKAVKLLYPPFREAIVSQVKIPFELTEMKPSELLACILSTMGKNIEKVKYVDVSKVDDNHTEVIVRITDKEGMEKMFTFILIKEEKKWKIASISLLR